MSSPGFESGRLFVIEVLSACLEFISLLLLSGTSTVCNLAKSTLVLTISQNLLSAKMLLLESPHALLILLLLASHFSLFDLHLALIHNLLALVSVHSLKVVRLDAMRCQHRLLRCGVLSHEIVVVSVVHIRGCLQLLILGLSSISVALLLCELHVSILDRLLHINSMLSVLVLCIGQQLMEVKLLFIMDILSVLSLLLIELLLSDLLLDPVLLL